MRQIKHDNRINYVTWDVMIIEHTYFRLPAVGALNASLYARYALYRTFLAQKTLQRGSLCHPAPCRASSRAPNLARSPFALYETAWRGVHRSAAVRACRRDAEVRACRRDAELRRGPHGTAVCLLAVLPCARRRPVCLPPPRVTMGGRELHGRAAAVVVVPGRRAWDRAES